MKPGLWLFLKGLLMGAADIVPGVSGGTIAFITGIYERLIEAIRGFLPALIAFAGARDWQSFVIRSDLGFLLILMSGILTSVFLFASLVTWLLAVYPIPLWSAFFGLILASVYLVQDHVKDRRAGLLVPLFLGSVIAFVMTSMSPASINPSLFNAFLSGLVAICAMILPGISGSFILVMLGSYGFILEALTQLDLAVMAAFASGCIIGLLSIAQVLGWAFEKYHDVTLAFLTGVMLGALNKVWPWREVVSVRQNRHGDWVPEVERNVMPAYYEQVTGSDALLFVAAVAALCSMIVVLGLSYLAKRSQNA